MALPLRPRAIPRCSACLHSYAWSSWVEAAPRTSLGSQLQTRGKKKMVNNSANVTVRLLKDMKTFGRAGAIVPVPRGLMRNEWYGRRVAAYVTVPEARALRLNNTPMERDYTFGVAAETETSAGTSDFDLAAAASTPPKKAAPEVQKITPERSLELLEIFVPHRLDFYRPPIVEETSLPPPEEPRARRDSTFSAADDLLAARAAAPQPSVKRTGPFAIYGSVSTQDILVMIRAAIARNDEAARVIVAEEDIAFGGTYAPEDIESGKIKRTGDFTVEIKVRGGGQALIRRTVRVMPQDV